MERAVAGRKTPKGPNLTGGINPHHSYLKQKKAEWGAVGGQKEGVDKKGGRRRSRGRGRRVGNRCGLECKGGKEGMLGKEKGRSMGKEWRGKEEKGRKKVSSLSLSMTNFMEGERGLTGEGRTREEKK